MAVEIIVTALQSGVLKKSIASPVCHKAAAGFGG